RRTAIERPIAAVRGRMRQSATITGNNPVTFRIPIRARATPTARRQRTDRLSISPGGSFQMCCEARRTYDVSICHSVLSPSASALPQAIGERTALLVTTPSVDRLYGSAMRSVLKGTRTVATLVLPAREETKSLELVKTVCHHALSNGLNRRGILIAF